MASEIDGTYDSTLDALKMTKPEYEGEVIKAVREIQEKEHIDLARAPKRDLRTEAEEIVDSHEFFDGFDGATLGAIVDWSDVSMHKLTRWHINSNAQKALRRMAREAMVEDILDSVREVKYQVEGPADE